MTTAAAVALAELRAMTKGETDPFGRTWNLFIAPRERRFWLRTALPDTSDLTIAAMARRTWAELPAADRNTIKSAVRRVASRAALLLSDPLAEPLEN